MSRHFRSGSISAAELRDLGDRCFTETGRSGSRTDIIADPDVTEQSMVPV
jgi:hypothetical protein